MAFVSGGGQSSSNQPQQQIPSTNQSQHSFQAFPSQAAILQQQLQESLVQQQQQQQGAAAQQNPMVQQLLAQVLLAQQQNAQHQPAPPPPPQQQSNQQYLLGLLQNQLTMQLLQQQQQQVQQQQQQQQQQHQQQQQQQQALAQAQAQVQVAQPQPTQIAQPQPQNAVNPLLYYQMAAQQLLGGQSQQTASASQPVTQTTQSMLLQQNPSTSELPQSHDHFQRAQSSAATAFQPVPQTSSMNGPIPARIAENYVDQPVYSNHRSQLKEEKPQISELSVQERISRLISDNEAIIQQPQVMIKRRPYHRSTLGSQSSIETDPQSGVGSNRTSPGSNGLALVREHKMPTTRSQSLYEPIHGIKAFGGGGSLTSGQPITRIDKPGTSSHQCTYCMVQFNNAQAASLHELTCSKRSDLQRPPPASTAPKLEEMRNSDSPIVIDNRQHPLKRRLLGAVSESPNKIPKAEMSSPAPHEEMLTMPIAPEIRRPVPGISSGLSRRATVASLSVETVANSTIPLQSLQSYQAAATSNLQTLQAAQAQALQVQQQLIQQQQQIQQAQAQAQAQAQKEAAIQQLVAQANQQNSLQLLTHLQQQQLQGQTNAVQTIIQSLINSGNPLGPHLALQLAQQAEAARQQQQQTQLQLLQNPSQQMLQQLGQQSAQSTARVNQQALLQAFAEAKLSDRQEAGSSTQSAFTPRNLEVKTVPPQVPRATQLVGSIEVIKAQLEAPSVPLIGDVNKPYTLVLSAADASKVAESSEAKKTNHQRAIASDTYCCLNTLLPSSREAIAKESAYSDQWKNSRATDIEKALNKLYLSTCQMTPGLGIKEYYRFTSANREGGQLRVTHSSFWEISTKLRLRQSQSVALLAAMSLQGPTNGLYEYGAKRPSLEQQAMASIVPEMVIGYKPQLPITTQISPIVQQATQIKIENKFQQERQERQERISPQQDEVEVIHIEKPITSAASSFPAPLPLKSKENKENAPIESSKSTRESRVSRKDSGKLEKKETVIGAHRTDEVYVYVRGRGRGRYICDRCGIRCKKPSMLKKHIKSHTDVRPYQCKQCNFSFKTKGNLTKHIASKSHRKKIGEIPGRVIESDEESDRLEIADEDEDMEDKMEFEDMDHKESSDDSDEEDYTNMAESMPYRKFGFGQENILEERATHTPPSRWVLVEEKTTRKWPEPDVQRNCSSAPPAAAAFQTPPIPPITLKEEALILTTPTVTSVLFHQNPTTQLIGSNTSNFLSPFPATMSSETPVGTALLSGDSSLYGQFLSKEEHPCTQCGKIFRKQAELTLHQHTHNIERQTAKNRVFQCPECRQPFRSKPLLSRHMETAHGIQLSLDAEPLALGDTSVHSVLSNTPPANPRSFLCSDCGIGFRKHGILAKHLRSKTHVVKLEGLGRLPVDSLNLIMKKDSGACLNDIDTTDCERARASLTAIVEAIRAEFATSDPPTNQPSSLTQTNFVLPLITTPCDSQLTQPVTAMTSSPQANTVTSTATFSSATPIPVSQNLLNTAAVIAGLASPRRPSVSHHNGSPRRKKEESPSMRPRGDSFSTMSSLEPQHRRRAETFGAISMRDLYSRTISANVWVPPKADSLERPRVPDAWSKASTPGDCSTEPGSSRSDDMDSMRSSSSTPVHRISNGHIPSPLMGPGKCALCDITFETHVELQVHMHADHISMRDGKDFRCPKKHCDKVYPSRDSLRQHIQTHYQRGLVLLAPVIPIENPEAPGRASPLTDTESSCPPSPADGMRDERSNSISATTLPIPQIPQPAPPPAQLNSLPCVVCGDRFVDSMTLQEHWLSHVAKRPHICSVCDAGFTTLDALNSHKVSHFSNGNTNGIEKMDTTPL
ncbi:unnamed protein product, partial [Mesorhabditis belari]|uniref:C2H2-type domain-containing protein n=1 Tax=Mesorhabditis belari TaxID=2138241 RepID=A0AAF3JAK3_9BILA